MKHILVQTVDKEGLTPIVVLEIDVPRDSYMLDVITWLREHRYEVDVFLLQLYGQYSSVDTINYVVAGRLFVTAMMTVYMWCETEDRMDVTSFKLSFVPDGVYKFSID